MRPLHPRSTASDEHAEAVSRRLATLSAELAAVRGDPPVAHRHTQVRGLHADPALDAGDASRRMRRSCPVPGRHSMRGAGRRGRRWRRLKLTGAHVAVISVVDRRGRRRGRVAGRAFRSRAGAGRWRRSSEAAGDALGPAVDLGSAGGVGDAEATDAGTVTVDVAGKVRRPGIAVLPPGSRVVDAVEAAGGARRGVDLASLNLARPAGRRRADPGRRAGPGRRGGLAGCHARARGRPARWSTSTPPISRRSRRCPGVGPVTAEAIAVVAHRARRLHGGGGAARGGRHRRCDVGGDRSARDDLTSRGGGARPAAAVAGGRGLAGRAGGGGVAGLAEPAAGARSGLRRRQCTSRSWPALACALAVLAVVGVATLRVAPFDSGPVAGLVSDRAVVALAGRVSRATRGWWRGGSATSSWCGAR